MNAKNLHGRSLLVMLSGFVLASTPVLAQKTASKAAGVPVAKVLPLDTAVRIGKLPNGFTYFIRHNEEPKERVLLYLVNKVGSILETEEQRGLAHFIEHMSFNGTKNFPKNELVDYLERSGVRFGADLNAYTSFDETVYQLPLPTKDKELLKNGFRIMRDWAQEATLDETEINKERGVIIEEKRLRKGADERMREQYWSQLLNHSRYADRMPIGIDTVLLYGKPETLRAFYRDWYRPDQQALVVVGDIDVAETEKMVKSLFATLKNPVSLKKRTRYTIPLTGKDQYLIATDPENTTTSAEILWKQPEEKLVTDVDYRKAVVKQLFNQMMGERYAEYYKQPQPPFIQGGVGIQPFMGGLQLFSASARVNNTGGLETGVKAVWREIERVKRFGFTQSELERAKQNVLTSYTASWKEKSKTPSENYVKEYQQYFLDSAAAPGIDYELALVKQLLPGITLADVNKVPATYIKATNRDVIIMAPGKDKAGLPDSATFSRWLQEVSRENITAYKDEAAGTVLLPAKPAPGRIVAQTQLKDVAGIMYTLSNGVKVVVKPTSYKNDEIGFSAFAPGGTSLSSDKGFQSAVNASGIIGSAGVGDFDNTALGKYLTGKQVGVKPFIGDRTQGVNGSAAPEDLETAMQLIYLYFTQPRKDSALFQSILNRSRPQLINRANDPNSVFSDTMNVVLGNYHFRRKAPSVEMLDQIQLDSCLEFYKARFADAAAFTFVFVGNIDTTTFKPLMENYLAALPATHHNQDVRELGIHPPAGMLEKKVYKGKEDKATVRLVFNGTYNYSEENNMAMEAVAEVLNIRLLERLREEESGVYTPSVSAAQSKYPQNRYAINISFGCSPQNVQKLIASTLDEVARLAKDGPATVNLEKFKAQSLNTLGTVTQTNRFWLTYLSSQLQNKEPLDMIGRQSALINKLTAEQVKQSAALYLNTSNYITFVLLPESAK
ncbi:M16 family metallopeptidase [Filimonas effusa]|uniref:M16 family metallopeptidase n=1 Tax=Filimonas effusa TaxID=2508721 RepID=UPI001C706C26|nr:insulinase family protein [Filimonas effusa]